MASRGGVKLSVGFTMNHEMFRELEYDLQSLTHEILPDAKDSFLYEVAEEFGRLMKDQYLDVPMGKRFVHQASMVSQDEIDPENYLRADGTGFDIYIGSMETVWDLRVSTQGAKPHFPNPSNLALWAQSKQEEGNADFEVMVRDPHSKGGSTDTIIRSPESKGTHGWGQGSSGGKTSDWDRLAFVIGRSISQKGMEAFTPNPVDVLFLDGGGLSDAGMQIVQEKFDIWATKILRSRTKRSRTKPPTKRQLIAAAKGVQTRGAKAAASIMQLGGINVTVDQQRVYTRRDGGMTLVTQGRINGRFTSPLGAAGVTRLDAFGRIIG